MNCRLYFLFLIFKLLLIIPSTNQQERDLQGLVELTSSVDCKTECIDNGLNYCPTAQHRTGYCCGADDCRRYDICSNDIKQPFSLKYWTCPFNSYCGNSFFQSASKDYTITLQPTTGINNFGYNTICNYMISFPSEAQKGDQIVLKVTLLNSVYSYLLKAKDFDEEVEQVYLEASNIYTVDFPKKLLLVLIGQTSTSNYQLQIEFAEGGVTETADWIQYNNQTYYFNETFSNTTDNQTTSNQTIYRTTTKQTESETLSTSYIVIIAVVGAVIILIIIIIIIVLSIRLKKQKKEVNQIKNKIGLGELLPGQIGQAQNRNQQEMDKKYQEFLMKRFGTVEVNAQLFYQHQKPEDKQSSPTAKQQQIIQNTQQQNQNNNQQNLFGVNKRVEENQNIGSSYKKGNINQIVPMSMQSVNQQQNIQNGSFLPPISSNKIVLPPIGVNKSQKQAFSIDELIDSEDEKQ